MIRLIRRPRRLILIVAGVAVFVVISGGLARWLTLEGVERDAVTSVLRAEARGDAGAMLASLHGCGRRCVAAVRADARRLKRPGRVLILAYDSATAYALTSKTGKTRVAWKAGTSLPVVQCFTVSRKGNVVSGLTVTLLAVSLPIPGTADC